MHAPGPILGAALAVAAAAALSGCQGASSHEAAPPVTVTVTEIPGLNPPLSTDVPTAGRQWSGGSDGTAMYSVGTKAQDGMAAVIPQGRYNVELAPGAEDGTWMVCDAALCGPAFQENATVIGHPVGPHTTAMYIGEGSRTLWLDNVVLSRIND